ncbi:hypothetical protein MASS_3473 [Mycobacteroides abscessus subsp. bolletii 50594]|uniref:Peptidase metallopeptidase domain-containing protein n=2 Tax=Mycobacteroides abscessus TaxID=36809 RepID=A0AB33AE19_9MYCO|nr:hypothetical protein MASS_3473 [Mycobacteroides abscessus subsp. bolletii 50594]
MVHSEGHIVDMKGKSPTTPGLRRVLAVTALAALVAGGMKVASDYATPGSGFSTVATVAADPTGPPAPTGGMTDGGGSQFQPPQMPSSMPDYQGGNNQPPLDQNSGISIYNSGNPQAPQQVPGQQGGQQPQQAQQPAHGTQIPDYQTNPGYTQGPGKPNPDYQAPQQQSPQQAQQQGQQPQQQQPTQAPTQTQPPTQQPTVTTQPGQETGQNNSEDDLHTDDFDDTSEVPDEKYRMDNGTDKNICQQSQAELSAGQPISNIDWFTMVGNTLNGPQMRVENATKWPEMVSKAVDEWKGLGVDISYFTPAWYRKGPFNADVKVVESHDPDFGPYGRTDWQNGIIYINTWLFEKENASAERIQETITHEIGHALGLIHGCAGTIMQRAHELSDHTIRPISPTALDKAIVRQIHQK